MGKTRRRIKKSLRNKKGRKSIRNKKGKRSIRRKSYKKMRGGYNEKVIMKFIDDYNKEFNKSGLDANSYVIDNIKNIQNSFEDRTDFLEALENIIHDKPNLSEIIKRKAVLIKNAFIKQCDEDDTFTKICYDNSSRITDNPFAGEGDYSSLVGPYPSRY